MDEAEAALAGGVGGPGPEDFRNGAAVLAAALVREALALAQAAAALIECGGGGEVAGRSGRAVDRARLALTASQVVIEPGGPDARAARLVKAAEHLDLDPAFAAASLRTAALSPPTDDAAARIAAASLANDLAVRVERAGTAHLQD